jgi:hypothetical protein
MCLKGFPSLEVSHRLLRVGFVGSRLPGEPKDLQCFAPVGRSRSRQQKDDKEAQEAGKAITSVTYRTEVGPADTQH